MVKETLTSTGIYSPCLSLFCLARFAVFLSMPLLYGSVSTYRLHVSMAISSGRPGGLACPLPVLSSPAARDGTRRRAAPRLRCPRDSLWTVCPTGRHTSPAMWAPFGDCWTKRSGRSCRTALTLAEEPTKKWFDELFSYGKMLHKNNTEGLYDRKMLLFKDRYLQFFCSVWGHFRRYTKQLVCTWFVSKKTFAHE